MSKSKIIILIIFSITLNSCSRKMISFIGDVDKIESSKFQGVDLKLYVFETGNMYGDGWGVYKGGKGKIDMDQPAFLIRHPKYGDILYEAGFNSNVSKEGKHYVGRFLFNTGLLAMSQDSLQDIRNQLISNGFFPDNIKYVIPSHFHPEHSGAIEEFPESEIVIDQREYEYIMGKPKYNFLKKEYDEVKKWKIIKETDWINDLQPFEGVIDWFGDSSVLVVSTPGHTPGHLSILLNMKEGPIMLTGDVAWRVENFNTETIGLPFISVHGKHARESMGIMKAFMKENPNILIVPGHDLNPLRKNVRNDVVLFPWPFIN